MYNAANNAGAQDAQQGGANPQDEVTDVDF